MSPTLRSALLVVSAACVTQPGQGPDLGRCAEIPDRPYTYGEVGIGTCLAGPTDVQFLTGGGRTLLGLVNADPFRTFRSGSFLLVDADQVAALRGTHTMDELEAWSLELEPFGGRFASVPGLDLAVVPSRFSENSYFRGDDDRAWLIDLADPTRPSYASRRFLTVGADPAMAVPDVTNGRVYVINSTTVSITVIDAASSPPDLLSPAPLSVITPPVFQRRNGSLGIAEMRTSVIAEEQIAQTDLWTATWLDGTYRMWVPTAAGVTRWSSGGDAYVPSGFGVELDPTLSDDVLAIDDPFAARNGQSLILYFADQGDIRGAFTDGSAGIWNLDPVVVVQSRDGWGRVLGGPSVLSINDRPVYFVDGRTGPGAPAAIGRARTIDGIDFTLDDEPVLQAPSGFDEITQPSPVVDPNTGTLRVWMTLRDGDRYSIGHAPSLDDGDSFEPIEEVLAPAGQSVGAPYVVWTGGRFVMWLSVSDGTGWAHATSWSWDGLSWSEPQIVVPSDRAFDAPPPRAAIQPVPSEAWRVEGADGGVLPTPAISGLEFASPARGFALQVVQGHVTGTDVGGQLEGGVEPGSLASPGGVLTMYATGIDANERRRLVALRQLDERWVLTRDDLMPEGAGGNVDGARDPVVFERDGVWNMIYATLSNEVWSLQRAVSTDGLTWTPDAIEVTGDRGTWENVERFAHSVVDDGTTLTLWYSGSEGSRYRISAMESVDGITWTPLFGRDVPYLFGFGDPGAFDDSGVRDPYVLRDGTTERMWYSGYDGATWSVGLATREDGGPWVRRTAPLNQAPAPLISRVPGSFSVRGAFDPVVAPDGDRFRIWYAGTDGFASRIGEAIGTERDAWPAHRFTRAGDRFTFTTRRGEPGRSSIQLGQFVQGVALPGAPGTQLASGPTAAVHDPARGFLYVASKDFNGLLVIDVRDDSTATFDDRNYLDIESVLRIDTTTALLGIHDMVLSPDGLIYASIREPDGVLVIDPSNVVDDELKEIVDASIAGALPMHDLTDDDGEQTFAAIGAAGLALVPGTDLLLVTHFRDNSLSIFDLSLGVAGEEIRHLEDLGDQPSMVRVAPDRTWAALITYLGDTRDSAEGSSLLVLDLDPTSPTYLQIRARLVNR